MKNEEVDKLFNLALTFPGVFAKHGTDIGHTLANDRPLELKPGAEPFKEAARRYSPDDLEEARRQVGKLLESDVIEPTKSTLQFCLRHGWQERRYPTDVH